MSRDRNHPPTDLGTFVEGALALARLIADLVVAQQTSGPTAGDDAGGPDAASEVGPAPTLPHPTGDGGVGRPLGFHARTGAGGGRAAR